jgi:hypothetical protein
MKGVRYFHAGVKQITSHRTTHYFWLHDLIASRIPEHSENVRYLDLE